MALGGSISRTDVLDQEKIEGTDRVIVGFGDEENTVGLVQAADRGNSSIPVSLQDGRIIEVLQRIDKNLTLLNIRFEEAFQTEITEGDVPDEN